MFPNQENHNSNNTVAESTAAQALLTPEAVVDALRALRAQIGEVTPLTPEQRRDLRARTRTAEPILQAGINVIGAADIISTAVGTPVTEVRELHDEALRWTVVEDELRALLNGIVGANLVRRQRVALVSRRARTLAAELAQDSTHSALVPHVEEINRLKSFKRRKKAAAAAPATAPSPSTPGTSGTTKS